MHQSLDFHRNRESYESKFRSATNFNFPIYNEPILCSLDPIWSVTKHTLLMEDIEEVMDLFDSKHTLRCSCSSLEDCACMQSSLSKSGYAVTGDDSVTGPLLSFVQNKEVRDDQECVSSRNHQETLKCQACSSKSCAHSPKPSQETLAPPRKLSGHLSAPSVLVDTSPRKSPIRVREGKIRRRCISPVSNEIDPATKKNMWGVYLFSMDEIARHCTKESCWLVSGGYVYDATAYLRLNEHPAGAAPILRKSGGDASIDFQFHSADGKKEWEKYRIGQVDESSCTIS